jgi:hypothetical protein
MHGSIAPHRQNDKLADGRQRARAGVPRLRPLTPYFANASPSPSSSSSSGSHDRLVERLTRTDGTVGAVWPFRSSTTARGCPPDH